MTITCISETTVLNENREPVIVVPGSKVRLKPPKITGNDARDRSSREHYEEMIGFMGAKGSYEIDWIGRWPCGRDSLYFKMPEGRRPGALAREFIFVE